MRNKEEKSLQNIQRFAEPNEDVWLPVATENFGNSEIQEFEQPQYVPIDETSGVDAFDLIKSDLVKKPTRFQKWRFKTELQFLGVVDWIKCEVEKERELGIAFLLIPVFFGLGCIIYFNLPREPLMGAFAFLALISFVLMRKAQAGGTTRAMLSSLCIVATGVAIAQLQTSLNGTKALSKTIFADVTGVIEKVEQRANGSHRYTINTSEKFGSLNVKKKSYDIDRIRLTARASAPNFKLNQTIMGRARVGPASGPAYPGGYDFGFQNWFNGIGGSGFFLGAPKQAAQQIDIVFSFKSAIADLRFSVGQIIRSSLSGNSSGLAAALIVGDRSGISKSMAEDLRKSGLAHILAISGLHMALISATVILSLRAVFSLAPGIVLHKPVKKWASCTALFVSAIYLLLSGAGVSTQRAFIMISIMLLAVLFDRRALTMRNVAIAAIVVLVLAPEAILSPGFQMSFSAVAALIASYEAMKRRREGKYAVSDNKSLSRLRKWIVRDIGGLAMTSVIAGAATGLFAAYHFQRVATLGLVANVLAMPFVSLMVMPLALLSVVAMPFGLESYPLQWMSAAIEPVTAIANWVANLGLVGNTGILSASSLLVGSLAIIIMTIFQSRLRFIALGLVPIVVFLTVSSPKPNILILENAQQIAVRDESGRLQILRPNAEKFNTDIWLRAFAPHRLTTDQKIKKPTFNPYYGCDDFGCSVQVKGKTVSWLKSTAQLQRDCRQSDILIVPFAIENACSFLEKSERPIVLETNRLKTLGSHAIYVTADQNNSTAMLTIKTAFVENNRPWLIHKNQ